MSLSEAAEQRLAQIDWDRADKIAKGAKQAARKREEELARMELRRQTEFVWRERGERYRRCTLENFRAETEAQQKVLCQVWNYANHLAEEIARGTNIVLIGPVGTGKDHLIAALMSRALEAGYTVEWTSGARLRAQVRDAMDGDQSEWSLVRRYTHPAVFVLSDPITNRQPLTGYQQNKLYEIVDARYNACRPIWVTINAEDRKEASALMGADIVDRLRDGALSLALNWESYRRPRPQAEVTHG